MQRISLRSANCLAVITVALACAACTAISPSTGGRAEIAYLAFTNGYWQVWVMEADGRNPRQVTDSEGDKSRVSWFPDGEILLVNSNAGTISRVTLAGAETPIPLELQPVLDAAVSPDGSRMAFSFSNAIDGNDIWISDIAGQHPIKLVKMAALQHEPAWSPSGDALYFLSGDGGQTHDIWRLSMADQRVEQITVASLYHFDVAVSSHGDLAFSSNRSGNYEIYVQRRGGPAERLTDHPALDAQPSFSPDGRSIVFESTRSGRPNLWRLELASGELTRLTDHPLGARAPVWFMTRSGSK